MSDDTLQLIDLAAARLGGTVLYANDEFFAPKESLLLPGDPLWIPDKYVPTGKWMDGWETRRRRSPGHDFCLIRLGARGVIDRVVVDTRHFRGNFPAECSIEGVDRAESASIDDLLDPACVWQPVLSRSALNGNCENPFAIETRQSFSHLRFSIFPDGGIARLRVLGRATPNWEALDATYELANLSAAESGARVLAVSDMFFGHPTAMLMPGRAADMSDGWETRRRRGPGHDWAIIELGARGRIVRAEVDTLHFRGNAPGHCAIDVCDSPGGTVSALGETSWRPLLEQGALRSHENHRFEAELEPRLPATHVRLRIYPDGGVSRLRLFGRTDRAERVQGGLGLMNVRPAAAVRALLLRCCASETWADQVLAARPFSCLAELFAVGDRIWRGLTETDYRQAFAAHPRIGDKADTTWSKAEQAGVVSADGMVRDALVVGNRDYEQRFGHVFLVCATGRSAADMLAALQARLKNDPALELKNAAEEQRKITHIRLFKGLVE